MLLLHGFPDFSYVWRHQIPAIAASGFRVVAPDLRGYDRSDKPRGVAAYDIRILSNEIAALVGALGHARAHAVVGHDWGGSIAWHLAAEHPDVVERLVVLNSPHPKALRRELRTLDQLARSAYVLFFQLPVLPELLLSANAYAMPLRLLRREVRRPGAISDVDIEMHRAALAQPRAMTSMLSYYRSTGRRMLRSWSATPSPRAGAVLAQPTLLLWGELDPYLSPRLATNLARWVPDLRVVRFPNAGHWVQLDEPERVNAEILEFLGR